VQLLAEYEADCNILNVVIAFSGPLSGGTLVFAGDPFASFTVQFPQPFDDYGSVGDDAYGDLFAWSPPGDEGIGYVVEPQFDINGRGADELLINAMGIAAVVSNVEAYFGLPLDLLGQTVYAQIHVGWNLCQCAVTAFDLPAPPSSPDNPPTASFEFSPASPQVGATVTFDATSSSDDVGIARTNWEFGDGGTGEGEVTTHSYATAGDFRVVVAVTDTSGQQDFAAATVTVTEPAPPQQRWDVYVHAHEDDWQLFLSPSPYHAYQAGDNLLFIYVTAGDAGQGSSYWIARELAAEASVKAIAGTGFLEGNATATFCYTASTQVCHDIHLWTYERTVSVYMRLPDSGVNGGGFPSTGYQSLGKLRDGNISSLNAIDGSTTYNGWDDLTSTLAAIINAYAPHDSTTMINGPDFDRDRQTTHVDICPDCPDHADHLSVADAVYAITIGAGAPWSRTFYIDYPIAWADSRYPANLDSANYDIKKQLFMAYNDRQKELTGIDEYAQMPWFWENCFQRDYSRTA